MDLSTGNTDMDSEATCRVNEARYRVLIEDVADGFYETNLNGDFLFFNNALCRIFGYSREELQNRNYSEFMDKSNAQRAYQDFNRIYRTGNQAVELLWEIIRKDGQKRFLEISAKLIREEQGNRVGFRGIARDITENYLARQQLEASRKALELQYQEARKARRRFKALLDFIPDPVFVFNIDGTVDYLNPAFERVFGWTLEEVRGRHIPFVPDELKEETRKGFERLFETGVERGLETRRLTKDGRVLDIILDAAIFYDKGKTEPSGQVIRLRDVTREKRIERVNKALFRIANALPSYRRLDDLLEYITREVQELMNVGGASVILMDNEKQEFFIRVASFEDKEAQKRMREIRFPADKGVAGQVYRTRKPVIVSDTQKNPFFLQAVDDKVGYVTRNMLDVPVFFQDRFIGVLCVVNKRDGDFNDEDVELASTIATTIALPLENTRINEALCRSYEEVKSLNRAKDRVLHHLSHELKTPVSVLSASLSLIRKKLDKMGNTKLVRTLERAQRNLDRVLDMQYRIEDILREKDYATYPLMSSLLDTSTDLLEALVADETGVDGDLIGRIRDRIDAIFGPRSSEVHQIWLHHFVEDRINFLRPRFTHRQCRLEPRMHPVPPIRMPKDVVEKVVDGLIRNAVENTPDKGLVEVSVNPDSQGQVWLTVRDFGVGITADNRPLLFQSQFSTRETAQYASKHPFDFNAGGRGFDLLRMKIFSERFGFEITMETSRCRFIPKDQDLCPGDISKCVHCQSESDCQNSGGTVVHVIFPAVSSGQTNSGVTGT